MSGQNVEVTLNLSAQSKIALDSFIERAVKEKVGDMTLDLIATFIEEEQERVIGRLRNDKVLDEVLSSFMSSKIDMICKEKTGKNIAELIADTVQREVKLLVQSTFGNMSFEMNLANPAVELKRTIRSGSGE